MPASFRALLPLLSLPPQALVGSVENTPVMEIRLFPQLVDNLSCVSSSGKGFSWGTLGRKGCSHPLCPKMFYCTSRPSFCQVSTSLGIPLSRARDFQLEDSFPAQGESGIRGRTGGGGGRENPGVLARCWIIVMDKPHRASSLPLFSN